MPWAVTALLLGLVPGLVAIYSWRGPRIADPSPADPSTLSVVEAAVLRDGTVGATRWVFAALLCRLARDGHCTLVRTRQRRWLRTVPVATVDLHADPRALSPFERTVLRQLGRHDTLNGFGFAGSTFRRRTLRDVRARLLERGWLEDHRVRSNLLLGLGLGLLGGGIVGLLGGSALTGTASIGLGLSGLIAAIPRYPVTEEGARRRADHRAYALDQRNQIERHLPDRPAQGATILVEALPALVLERVATPQWLDGIADRIDARSPQLTAPSWIRDEVDGTQSFADALRTLGTALDAMGARRNFLRSVLKSSSSSKSLFMTQK